MPRIIAPGRWEATCAHCFNESDPVSAPTADAAADAIRAAGWLSAHPDGEEMKWWCIHCRAKLFESGRRGRKR
jgi:hypothetical protein